MIDISHENCIRIIQRKYLYKRFVKHVQDNKSLFESFRSYVDNTNVNLFDNLEKKFEKFNMLLMKTPSKIIIKLLEKIYRYKGFDEKISLKLKYQNVLISWLIVSFPEFTLYKTRSTINNINDYPDDIFFICEKFVNDINMINKNEKIIYGNEFVRSFNKNFNKFSNGIYYYFERRKIEDMYKSIQEYFQINDTIHKLKNDSVYDSDIDDIKIAELEKIKSILLTEIRKIDSTIKKDDLENNSNLIMFENKKIMDLQKKILFNDIATKKYVYFEKIIEELKRKIQILSKNTIDIDDKFDFEIIIRTMNSSGLSIDDINNYGDYLLSIINNLQAPAMEVKSTTRWALLKENYNKTTNVIEFLIKLLYWIIEEIKEIEEMICLLIS